MQDRAALDPGGMASDGRIGSGFQRCASQKPRAARPRQLAHPWLARPAVDASMREDIEPVQWIGQQAVVAHPVLMDTSNAGQVREELLSVINGGATALIADMTTRPRVITLARMP